MTLVTQVLAAVLGITFCALLAGAAWAAFRLRGSQRKRRLLHLSIGFGVWLLAVAAHYALIFFVYLPGLGFNDPTARPGTIVRIGQQVPRFQLATVDGAALGPEQINGHVAIINFFATWCGPCLIEMPELQRIWSEHKANTNFILVCVAREESNELISAYRLKHRFTLPMAADPTGAVYSLFATNLIPRTYLVDRDGKVLYQWAGNYPKQMAKLDLLVRKQLAGTPGVN
jgi:thiol-disulfide isomerase/thioredoxin